MWHLYGDKVILKVAAIINSALNGRGIVGRFGGDEFFIFTNWITKESQLRSILTFIKQKVRAELGQGTNIVHRIVRKKQLVITLMSIRDVFFHKRTNHLIVRYGLLE